MKLHEVHEFMSHLLPCQSFIETRHSPCTQHAVPVIHANTAQCKYLNSHRPKVVQVYRETRLTVTPRASAICVSHPGSSTFQHSIELLHRIIGPVDQLFPGSSFRVAIHINSVGLEENLLHKALAQFGVLLRPLLRIRRRIGHKLAGERKPSFFEILRQSLKFAHITFRVCWRDRRWRRCGARGGTG